MGSAYALSALWAIICPESRYRFRSLRLRLPVFVFSVYFAQSITVAGTGGKKAHKAPWVQHYRVAQATTVEAVLRLRLACSVKEGGLNASGKLQILAPKVCDSKFRSRAYVVRPPGPCNF